MSLDLLGKNKERNLTISFFEVYAGNDFIGVATTILDLEGDADTNFKIIPGKVEKGINKFEFDRYLHLIENENLLRKLSMQKRKSSMIKKIAITEEEQKEIEKSKLWKDYHAYFTLQSAIEDLYETVFDKEPSKSLSHKDMVKEIKKAWAK